MHGIQHLLRQHAIEKQISTDSWHSAHADTGGGGGGGGRTREDSGSSGDTIDGTPTDFDETMLGKSPGWCQGTYIYIILFIHYYVIYKRFRIYILFIIFPSICIYFNV